MPRETEAELREISFNEDVEIVATRLHARGHADSMATARAMCRPQMEKERVEREAEREAEEAEERGSMVSNHAPGREGSRRRSVAIV